MSALVGIVAAAMACSGSESEPPKPTATAGPTTLHVVGTFLLKQSVPPYVGPRGVTPTPPPSCRGRGGYSDITEGMEVVLSADGTTVDVGRFSAGKVKSSTEFYEH